MPEPYALPDLPPSPGGGAELKVGCRTRRTGSARHKHAITISEDWTAHTPHDIELERIAIAMGGYLSCVDLVDHTVPAVRELVQRQGRRIAPQLRRSDGGRWVLPGPALACGCDEFGFAGVEQAAEHFRSPQHVLCEFAVASGDFAQLAGPVQRGWETLFALPPAHGIDALVRERRGVEFLWDAGLHPKMISAIHRAVWPDGPPLPAWFYLGAMSRRPNLDWIATTLRTVPDEDIAVWLCWTDAALDRAHPEARTGWLQAGVPRVAIAALAEGAYAPIDVARLSHATGRSIPASATTLAAWHRAGSHPSADDIALLDELGVDRWYEPSTGAVDWLWRRFGRGRLSRTQLALVLAVCGTRAGAVKALTQGVVDPVGAARVMNVPVERELTAP